MKSINQDKHIAEKRILEKGKVYVFSKGYCDDYRVLDSYKVVNTFDLDEVAFDYAVLNSLPMKVDNPHYADGTLNALLDPKKFNYEKFIEYLVSKGLIELFNSEEVYFGEYEGFDIHNQDVIGKIKELKRNG